ncbi:MAG: Rho-binding antiterminator [Pseudomonadota bacterium]
MSDYVPISCMAHERLEFAVLRGQKLRLRLKQEDGSAQELVVLPTDVATRNQAEWLSFRKEDGQTDEVRLDQILSADPMGNR